MSTSGSAAEGVVLSRAPLGMPHRLVELGIMDAAVPDRRHRGL